MENEIYIDGLGIATGVVDTIVALAAAEVEGVAGIGDGAVHSANGGSLFDLKGKFGARQNISTGVDVIPGEDGIAVCIRMQVYYGYRLIEVSEKVREAVADAVLSQVGTSAKSVDVFIDGIVFAE